jgi:hypothetical protein
MRFNSNNLPSTSKPNRTLFRPLQNCYDALYSVFASSEYELNWLRLGSDTLFTMNCWLANDELCRIRYFVCSLALGDSVFIRSFQDAVSMKKN